MPTVTPTNAFIDAMRYGATLVSARITPYVNGKPSGTVLYGTVSTGTFTIDRNSNQRSSGQLTLEVVPPLTVTEKTPIPANLPVNPTSLFAPFGNEVFVETGLAGSGNLSDVTWLPNGLFAIATSVVADTSIDMTVTLDLYDRSWTIAQRTLKTPYNFPAVDGNFVDEINHLLNQVWGQDPSMAALRYNIAPTDQVVPTASYGQGSDPWQACLDLAAAIGYELYVDPNGIVTGHRIPDPYALPTVWNFTDQPDDVEGDAGTGSTSLFGDAYSTPAEVSVTMTRDGIYNDVVIQGTGTANMATYSGSGLETSGPPALGEAFDNNPQSPTYTKGGMGDVPNFVSSSLVSQTGAPAAAANQLQITLSSSWEVTLSIPPMGLLYVDDVVSITRPRVGFSRTKMVIDTITQVIHYADLEQITGRVLAQPFYLPVGDPT